jgi:hypothetical protein
MALPSVCLYTILFTIKDRKPSENEYVKMFVLWISQLLSTNALGPNDALRIYIDIETFNYLKTTISFEELCTSFPFKLNFILLQPPPTLYEGCCWKYIFDPASYTQDVLLYCDIDIYISSPLGPLFKDIKETMLYVHPEGSITNLNYGAHFSEKELMLFSNAPGLSAGKFAIGGKAVAERFFSLMKECITKHRPETPYYTLEQPLFNYIIYSYIHPSSINFELFQSSISINLNNYNKEKSVFLDCMGDPGNGAFHLEKFIHIMSLFHTGIL